MIVIVGGGIAGLATAYELSRHGLSFVLLEGAARPGGVILSEEIDGFVIDGGPDALLIQKPDGIKLCVGAELFVPARRDDADESIGSFMTRRFGREATTYLAEPLLAGIHAGDVDRLSIRALFPRFVEAERRHGSLLKAFRRETAHRLGSATR